MIYDDGHVASHALQFGEKLKSTYPSRRDSLVKARIDEVIYPSDERNSTRNSAEKRIEYTCTILGGIDDGKKIFNVIDSGGGAQFNNEITVRTPTTNQKSEGSKETEADNPATSNGEIVLLQYLYGHGDVPVIVGNMQSPLQQNIPDTADGISFRKEFNGMVFTVDKNGSFTFSFGGGPKDRDGNAANEEAAGSSFSIDANGNMTFTNGAGQSFSMNRENNTITMGSSGNSIEINTSSGNVSLGNSGSTTLNSSGSATVKGGGIATLQGSSAQIQHGGMPAARMGDYSFGIGNKGAPVMSRLIQGSGGCMIGA